MFELRLYVLHCVFVFMCSVLFYGSLCITLPFLCVSCLVPGFVLFCLDLCVSVSLARVPLLHCYVICVWLLFAVLCV